MMKTYKISLLVLMISAAFGCSVKSTNSKDSNALGTSSTGTTSSSSGSSTSTSTTSNGCDGVYHDGVTRCYYKNIPTIQVMGPTSTATANGTPFWSSATLIASGTGISPNQFTTDGTFNLRIIPRFPISGVAAANPALSGKTCSAFSPTTSTYKKLYVQVRLRQQNSTGGEVATLTADLDQPSKVWHFSPPTGTSQPLILEVVNVMADIRCNWSGGKSYCPYADIPLNSPTKATIATECVAFDLQYSTDETYDLPGLSAN